MSEQASPFATAAAEAFEALGGSEVLHELGGLVVHWKPASVGAIRRAQKQSLKGDDAKFLAILVRDHCTCADGQPIVTRDEAGTEFLMTRVSPAIIVKLGKLIAGPSADDAGND